MLWVEYFHPKSKPRQKMKILTIFAFIFFGVAEACQVQRIDTLNLSISTKDNSVVSYNAEKIQTDIPTFRATNCSNAAMSASHLMVAVGPEVVDYEDNVVGVNFNRDFGYKRCSLIDHPFKNSNDYEGRKVKFEEDWDFIKSCIEVTVEDEGTMPIQSSAKQVGCDLKKLSSHKVSFNGGFCFIKPSYTSSYLIQLKIKKDCQNLESLTNKKIKRQDIFGAINLYLAGDDTGTSSNLKALSNLKFRTTINPIPELLSASDDFGIVYPTFSDKWYIPDIHLGKLHVTSLGNEKIIIENQLLVNNFCPPKCKDNFCQSICDYAQPIVSENSLYEVKEKSQKLELLTSWYDGGVAPPKFQGFIKGIGFEVPEIFFTEGKKYIIKSVFYDPKYDFDKFKNRVKSKLNTIQQQLGRISNSSIPNIQTIPALNSSPVLPNLNTIPGLTFNQQLDGVDRALEQLRAYLDFKLWPPYYTGACFDSKCSSLKNKILELETEFVFTKQNENDSLAKVIKSSRRSELVPSYEMNKLHDPKILCN